MHEIIKYFIFFIFFLIFVEVFAIIYTSLKELINGFNTKYFGAGSRFVLGAQANRMEQGNQALTLNRIKSLVMNNLPMTAGVGLNYAVLQEGCRSDGHVLNIKVEEQIFYRALSELVDEQCVVFFKDSEEVRPTQYGINKYS